MPGCWMHCAGLWRREHKMSQRILEEKIELDYRNVQEFFERRGANKQLGNKYNYVLYQDDCPELAVKRDLQEKEKISRVLHLETGQRVLDIGCGIGRWGEYLLEKGLYYVGIDGSPKMIERAENNLKKYAGKKLIVGSFQQFPQRLDEEGETALFDKVFVNGVFMYLNDRDYRQALKDIHGICVQGCELYIKESMGIKERLTLDRIYSESLTQEYSAIYRSVEEYRETMAEEFSADFRIVEEGRLFGEELENRAETTDYYFIWRR